MRCCHLLFITLCLFFFNDTPTTEIYTLSLHDALPICSPRSRAPTSSWGASTTSMRGPISRNSPGAFSSPTSTWASSWRSRSEEHTSELQSHSDLVCRLLLEKKKKKDKKYLNDQVPLRL